VNWREARDLLDGKGKRRGPRDSLKIARNTYLERGPFFRPGHYGAMGNAHCYPSECSPIGLRLHSTYVVIFTPRWTELYTGGWHTVTTRNRIEYAVSVRSDRGGWFISLIRDDLPCYCLRERVGFSEGICIEGETHSDYESPGGLELSFTDKWTGEPYDRDGGSKPIYKWVTCSVCGGSAKRRGPDWENSHPYFDGMRVSPDGKRLMREQPHKPAIYRPVTTHSGW
jgi:hypothetical protein